VQLVHKLYRSIFGLYCNTVKRHLNHGGDPCDRSIHMFVLDRLCLQVLELPHNKLQVFFLYNDCKLGIFAVKQARVKCDVYAVCDCCHIAGQIQHYRGWFIRWYLVFIKVGIYVPKNGIESFDLLSNLLYFEKRANTRCSFACFFAVSQSTV
jgi:hypothetical protein